MRKAEAGAAVPPSRPLKFYANFLRSTRSVCYFFYSRKTSFLGGKQIGFKHGAEAHLPDQRSGQAQRKTHII
jgi:hypothetical protein